MTEEIIRLEGVSKKFGDHFTLKNINLKIKEGETLGIIGVSGSGKSVLIHIIRGYKDYEPTEGRVLYIISLCKNCYWVDLPSKDGQSCPRCGEVLQKVELDIWRIEDKELSSTIKRRVGIMLQRTFALFSEKSALENVMEAISSSEIEPKLSFGTTSRRDLLERAKYANNIVNRAVELLKAVNLSHRMLTIARDLSGGEKQRVILARQIALDPILLLADEPTGTLDPENTRVILETLRKYIKNEKKTLILTSHIPEIIQKLSDRVVWLDKGEIIAEGKPKELITKFLEQVSLEELKTEVKLEEELLKIKDVKKYYYSVTRGVVKAVDGVSFEVKEGEIFGILGPSGSGKTTLSRIIAGIAEVTSGEVFVRIGDEWIDMRTPGITGRGRATPYIGILHQEYSLYPHRTVLDNLTDCISLDLPSEFARIRAIDILTSIGFDEREAESILAKYPDELSEGQRHRVALAQVMIREPRILILDEPSGTMDPITKLEVAKTLSRVRKEFKTTILIISHDMQFTKLTCDRVAIMLNGKLEGVGSAEEMIKKLKELELKFSEPMEISAPAEETGMLQNIDKSSCGV
ncbi:MAG: methyl coenzyme M reductase system, component A2 [Archaeoglobaceae archaeon]|nr:methyl coenzyme M reductase system, component A2 [Archaeoglobaceae archaeon]MDW8118436.1 methyl coenzyme M reductase system, component A2 [Archaeoglobaceae archaeon]